MPKGGAKRGVAGEPLSVPYSSIIRLVPQELWGKLAPAGVAGYNLTLSRKSVLDQIPHGAVKVSFGELRRGAPAGVFAAGGAEDGRMIDLPLAEILAQLHPDAYARRPNQVRVQVSEEVPDLFGAKGERLANVRVMEKRQSTGNTATITRQKVPAAGHSPAQASAPIPAPIPSNITPLPMPQAPPAPAAPQPTPGNAPIPAPNLRMPAAPAAPAPAKPAAPASISLPKPSAPAAQPASRPLPKAPAAKAPATPAPIPFNPFPSPPPAAAVSSPQVPAAPVPVAPIQCSPSIVATANALGFGSVPFMVGIDRLASAWPSGVRQELAQLKIPDAKIAFPTVEICEGLKRGRIQYQWRTLRTWLQPTPFYATPSPYDETMIELPLSTLTPIFLEFIRNTATDQSVASAEGITEFFRRAEAFSGTSAEPLRVVEQSVSISSPVVTPLPVPAPPVPQAQSAAPVLAPAAPAAPAPQETTEGLPPSVSAIENGKLCLPVSQICQGWPEPILRDIQQFALSGARIEIPVEEVEPGLKSGRIEFTWGQLCAWLRPASRAAQVSINAELRLPLPLNVVAPIFVKQRETGRGKKRVHVEDAIPDVFSAAGKPVVASTVASHQSSSAHAPAAPAPAPAGLEAAPAAAPVPAPTPRKLAASVSELFGEPDKKSWTPNEIVQRTVTLPNVAGSLIAMQDGLLVAQFMPPTVKTETIAAFVPQIFGRLNQYCKELQMGEAQAVSFTVDVGTVHVFNAGIIYFAALSKPGELLPIPELQLIASELSRHTK